MLQSYAVSVVSEKPNGGLQHLLYILEASSLDAAEGRVMAGALKAGHVIIGLISRSCDLTVQSTLAGAAGPF